jgi:glycosyltransferase involved in cell wall biosynthesis
VLSGRGATPSAPSVAARERGPRVVQVSFIAEAERRDPEALLAAWSTLVNVAASVARAGVQLTVVLAAVRDQMIERDGVRYEFVDDGRAVPRRSPMRDRRVRQSADVIDHVVALGADVVHLHGFVRPLLARRLRAALRDVPLLVQDHGSTVPGGARRLFWRLAFGDVDAVAFAASEQAAPFFDAGILRRGTPVFELFEDSTPFGIGDRDAARAATGLFGDPCILWTGRLDPNKDPLVMLDAFERAAPELPDARLWCRYGDAPLLGEVERRIAASPILRERVTLLGRCAHAAMEAHYRAADLFVQPSHREGCSYSTIEALACGVSPVVSDIPSMRKIVGDVGALVPCGDATALAAAIVEAARRDPPTRRAAARARFESALAYEHVGRALRSAYETMMA